MEPVVAIGARFARAHGTEKGEVRPRRAHVKLLAATLLALALLLALPFAAPAFAVGSIQGTVTDATSAPLQGIVVTAYDPYGYSYVADTSTSATGSYDLGGLSEGYYVVGFSDPGGWYVTEYYDDQEAPDYASWVWVSADGATGSIDAALAQPCSIGGTVTASATGDPLPWTWVHLYEPNGWGGWDYVTSELAGSTGVYSFSGLRPGEYRISFAPADGAYVPEFYLDAPDVWAATSLYPGDGETLTIDAAIEEWSTVSGQVTDAWSAPLADIQVELYRSDGSGGWDWWTYTYSDTSGNYTFTGLAADDYCVAFYDYSGRYIGEYYDDVAVTDGLAAATDVPVGSGQDVSGVDAQLSEGGHIAGAVTNRDGQGLAGIEVDVYRTVPYFPGYEWASWTMTNADGTYDVPGLAAGAYRVVFNDYSSYLYWGEWYDDQEGLYSATEVPVALDLTTSGIDAVLDKPAVISGTITGPSGEPVPNVYVAAYDAGRPDWRGWQGSTRTRADGSYTIEGLSGGDYHIWFEPSRLYVAEAWDDRETMTEADIVQAPPSAELTGVDAQLSLGASISGVVLGQDGAPLERAEVVAYSSDGDGWDYAADTSTDSTGAYTLPRLSSGTYRVKFDGGGRYFIEWWNDARSMTTAADIAVARDEHVTGIDAQLTEGTRIQGQVTGPIGESLEGIWVSAYRQDGHGDWDYVNDTSTDAGGRYSLGHLDGGNYKIGFHDWGRYEYVEEYWNDKAELGLADPMTLAFGETRSGVDAQLDRSSRITGSVTDQAGTPLADVWVAAYRLAGDGEWYYTFDATTDTAGSYELRGLRQGTYRVSFRDWSGFWAPEWFNDKATLTAADDVVVGVYETVPGIDAVLSESGKIRGTVTASGDGPVANVYVTAYSRGATGGWEYFADATTDAVGQYEIRGLGSGEYRVGFQDDPWWWGGDGGLYLDEYWDDKETLAAADGVAVMAPDATEGIDAVLTPGGHVTGTVTNDKSEGLESVYVYAYKSDGGGGWDYVGDTSTDATGLYDIGGLRSGTYRLQFDAWYQPDYVGEWYDDKDSLDTANDVDVMAGATTAGIDAGLGVASQVTGTVTDQSGAPVAGVKVTAYREDAEEGWFAWTDATTDATGGYTLARLSQGDYKVGFDPPTSAYAFEYWDDRATLTEADVVPVPAESIVTGIDAQLGAGGSITGTVTVGGVPRGDVWVTAYAEKPGGGWEYVKDCTTAADGTYGLGRDASGSGGMAAAVYRLKFNAHDPDLAPEFYNDKASLAAADDVVVTAGEQTTGIDADLGAAGRIAGVVTSDGGSPLADIQVAVYRSDGSGGFEYTADATTDFSGRYVIGGLAADTYRVVFHDWYNYPSAYADEWHHDAATLDQATDVPVVAAATTAVDESLSHIASILSVSSSSHPDEGAWYASPDVALSWLVRSPGEITGYSYKVDHDPAGLPDKLAEGSAPSAAYTGLSDGLWYFHVRGVVVREIAPWWTEYLWGPAAHFALHVDTTAPETEVSGADDAWHTGPVTLGFAPSDALSGMEGGAAKTEYSLDDGASWTTGVSAQVTGDGVHTVLYRSTDNAGNTEADKSVTVKIDATAPATTVIGSDDGWHREPVALFFTAEDAAGGSGMSGGAAGTEYKVDDGDWTAGSGVSVGTNGAHTVLYRSTDAAGNTETAKSVTVRIDTAAPATTQTGADDAWHGAPVTVTLTPADGTGSGMVGGLARTEYKLDDGSWTTGTSVTVASDGVHTVVYRSTDAAGNMEAEKSATVKVDLTAPVTTQTGADEAWHGTAVTVTFTPADGGAGMTGGLAKTEYKLDTGSWTTGTSVTVGTVGVHTLLYRSTDAVGNVEADRSVTVKIETNAPITLVSGADDLWHNEAVSLTFTADDPDGSGVARTEFSTDGGTTWQIGFGLTIEGLAGGGADGEHIVMYRSVDVVGNVEPTQSVTVRLDTVQPKTRAPYRANVIKGRYVKLRYKIDDALPNGGKANARIIIKNSRNRVVLRMPWRSVNVNDLRTWRFRCKLDRGTYRFYVYGTDLAGNSQSRIGSNRLTVK